MHRREIARRFALRDFSRVIRDDVPAAREHRPGSGARRRFTILDNRQRKDIKRIQPDAQYALLILDVG